MGVFGEGAVGGWLWRGAVEEGGLRIWSRREEREG